jgi:protoporphyrinogen oxidase
VWEIDMKRKTAIIIGAGPAGLTAAYELVSTTDIIPTIFEQSADIGGISKTVNYKGNRIDIGGHRFFSKSDRVMKWWQNMLPLQGKPSRDDMLLGRTPVLSTAADAPDPEFSDRVMLVRSRLSRILFERRFFDYPISLNRKTITNLGIGRIVKIGVSYVRSRLLPIVPEISLKDFLVNRFGDELYKTFFEDYTEKVWGVPCSQIPSEWGHQRIKGLSVTKALLHAVKRLFTRNGSISQQNVETSLIETFLYPKLGPGQMWEEVARRVIDKGGRIILNSQVTGISHDGHTITGVSVADPVSGNTAFHQSDYVISTMPVKELIGAMTAPLPQEVSEVAQGLMYRDFITVGLLLKKLKITNRSKTRTLNGAIPDNWIYIQDRDVRLGRIQFFNNWSPYLVNGSDNVWIGLEYFCNRGDALWEKNDEELIRFAVKEAAKIEIIDPADVLDYTVIRMPNSYPAYFGTYDRFSGVREYLDAFSNLFLIGRNGMHRYNNQDHSMLTAMATVDNIRRGIESKDNIWSVNAETDYHESN